MSLATHRPHIRLVATGVALLLAIGATGCGGVTSEARLPSGSIAVVTGSARSSDRGNLVLMGLPEKTSTVLGSGVSGNDALAYLPTRRAIVAVDYAGATPRIVSYDVGGRRITKLVSGRRPAVGKTSIAFCDGSGALDLIDFATSETSVVANIGTNGCTPMAWSADGQLAFVLRAPIHTATSSPISLNILGTDRNIRQIPLPEATIGVGALSWSADSARIALSMDHRRIVVKDVATGETVSSYVGDRAQYAPDKSELAILEYSTTDTDASISIYSGSSLKGERGLGKIRRYGFDWIRGEDAVVIAMDTSVGVWQVGLDRFTSLPVDEKVFGNILWIPR